MLKKYLPYIFLLLLIIVLIFIGGVKYGQKVEETNKVIKYVLSITPTKAPPTPTAEKKLKFDMYKDENYCGITFLYPNTWTLDEDRTGSNGSLLFLLDSDNEQYLTLVCNWPNPDGSPYILTPIPMKSSFEADLQLPKNATSSVIFKDKKITAYIEKNNQLAFKFWHPKIKDTYIVVHIDKNFYPIFEKTLEFITPVPTNKPKVTSIISP